MIFINQSICHIYNRTGLNSKYSIVESEFLVHTKTFTPLFKLTYHHFQYKMI